MSTTKPAAAAAIVCGVDASPEARAALELAVHLSDRLALRLVLVHAVEPPMPSRSATGVPLAGGGYVEMDLLREAGETLLERLARELGLGAGVARKVLIGGAGDAVATTAEEERAELVVVGSRGLGAIGGALLGSVSRWLAAHASCPTVVVSSEQTPPAAGPVVCAVDESEPSRRALRVADRLAERLGLRLVLVHAAGGSREDDGERAAGEELLAALASDCGLGSGVRRQVVAGDAAEAIVAFAAGEGAALIVLGSRGRGALRSALLGSVSATVGAQAPCPVVVVPHG